MTDARLLHSVEDNAAGWHALLARQPGAEVHDGWVLTDDPFPLSNSVFFPRWSDEEADARLDEILGAAGERDVGVLLWTGPRTTPADLPGRLRARGWDVELEDLPAMLLALEGHAAPPAPEGLVVEQVGATGLLRDFAGPFSVAFGIPERSARAYMAAFASAAAEGAADVANYVAYLDHRPVGTASMLHGAGVAGLYNVATLPEARGRGVGTALSTRAVADSASRGDVTHAMLHASAEGLPIYARMGFEEVARVRSIVATRQTAGA